MSINNELETHLLMSIGGIDKSLRYRLSISIKAENLIIQVSSSNIIVDLSYIYIDKKRPAVSFSFTNSNDYEMFNCYLDCLNWIQNNIYNSEYFKTLYKSIYAKYSNDIQQKIVKAIELVSPSINPYNDYVPKLRLSSQIETSSYDRGKVGGDTTSYNDSTKKYFIDCDPNKLNETQIKLLNSHINILTEYESSTSHSYTPASYEAQRYVGTINFEPHLTRYLNNRVRELIRDRRLSDETIIELFTNLKKKNIYQVEEFIDYSIILKALKMYIFILCKGLYSLCKTNEFDYEYIWCIFNNYKFPFDKTDFGTSTSKHYKYFLEVKTKCIDALAKIYNQNEVDINDFLFSKCEDISEQLDNYFVSSEYNHQLFDKREIENLLCRLSLK